MRKQRQQYVVLCWRRLTPTSTYYSTDDLIIMPLQSGTQWDTLAHVRFDGAMYNGHPPAAVSGPGSREERCHQRE